MLKLDEAAQSVDSTNVEKVKVIIVEAKDLLKHRQKIIKLTDQSEHG